jgi:hypothetical protein
MPHTRAAIAFQAGVNPAPTSRFVLNTYSERETGEFPGVEPRPQSASWKIAQGRNRASEYRLERRTTVEPGLGSPPGKSHDGGTRPRIASWNVAQWRNQASDRFLETFLGEPFYKVLFPVAPSEAVAPVASPSQNQFVKALVDRIETDSRYESLRGRASALKAAQTDLDRAQTFFSKLRKPKASTNEDTEEEAAEETVSAGT